MKSLKLLAEGQEKSHIEVVQRLHQAKIASVPALTQVLNLTNKKILSLTNFLFHYFSHNMTNYFLTQQEVVRMKMRQHQENEYKRIRKDSTSFASEESSR